MRFRLRFLLVVLAEALTASDRVLAAPGPLGPAFGCLVMRQTPLFAY